MKKLLGILFTGLTVLLIGCTANNSFESTTTTIPDKGTHPLPLMSNINQSSLFKSSSDSSKAKSKNYTNLNQLRPLLENAQKELGQDHVAVYSVKDSTGSWYSYYVEPLTFPDSLIDKANGSTIPYLFYEESADGNPPRVAVSQIPAHIEAYMFYNEWIKPNVITTGQNKSKSQGCTQKTYQKVSNGYWVCTEDPFTGESSCSYTQAEYDWVCEATTEIEYEWPTTDPGGGGGDTTTECLLDGYVKNEEGVCVPEEDQFEQIKNLLENNEFALLDVPCDEISKWQNLAQHEVPQAALNRIENTDILSGSFIQNLEDASGAVVNMDNFSITVPGNEIPNNWTAEEYLDHIRTNINDYVDGSTFEFYPGLIGEKDKWTQAPLGTLFSIQLIENAPWLDDGTVIASGYDTSFWLFTTVYTPEDNWHPVSGNRLFGVTDNGNGTYTYYTKGVDRLSTRVDQWAQSFFGIPFNSADDLWSSFQNAISDDFENATIKNTITYRPDYELVKDVLNGDAPISNLGCN